MSAAEKEKWLPWEEIEKAVSKYRESYWPRLVSKTTWSEEEFRLFQEILLSTCYTGTILATFWRSPRLIWTDFFPLKKRSHLSVSNGRL